MFFTDTMSSLCDHVDVNNVSCVKLLCRSIPTTLTVFERVSFAQARARRMTRSQPGAPASQDKAREDADHTQEITAQLPLQSRSCRGLAT